MPFEFFLAQTAAEIQRPLPKDARKAWMACHFSSYGTGISNLPQDLPEGSMVIVNDFVPVADHDPERIAQQLKEVVKTWQCSRVLLDFQRPNEDRTSDIAKAIVQALPCPVGVSEHYVKGLDCPVFLPPLPLHMALSDYIGPWQGRPVWLELMPDRAVYTVTEKGCTKETCEDAGPLPHLDEQACCRYRIEVSDDAIRFTLCRGATELAQLRKAEQIDCFVGLYQDFAQPEAQETALDQ